MGIPASATILYSVPKPGSGHTSFRLHESAERQHIAPQPDEVLTQVDGFMVGTHSSMGHLRYRVLLERDGTHIRIESTEMALHEIIDLACSLVPLAS